MLPISHSVCITLFFSAFTACLAYWVRGRQNFTTRLTLEAAEAELGRRDRLHLSDREDVHEVKNQLHLAKGTLDLIVRRMRLIKLAGTPDMEALAKIAPSDAIHPRVRAEARVELAEHVLDLIEQPNGEVPPPQQSNL